MRKPWDKKLTERRPWFFFSRNTKEETRQTILIEVGVSATNWYEKYLGLLPLIGRSRISSFNSIKGRIWNKINGWKEKFLSHAGKEILLKAVIQAIPTYMMNVFQIPKALIREINAMMGKFWWGHLEQDPKIA
jgi:hypothetical protein